MRVDFYNFKYVPEEMKILWSKAFNNCLQGGQFIGGNSVATFENKFSEVFGTRFSIGVSNGFDGLVLALRALDIGKGMKVALPAHTFIATWNAVIAVGATPVGVEVSEDAQIDVIALKNILNQEKIDCVIPVHMHGHVSDLKMIRKLCEPMHIPIIEDASQAHLAYRDELQAGCVGDIGVFSLYPTKNLGALGDAGVVVTDREELARKIKSLRNYGADENSKYHHSVLGFNCRLDAIQASILTENLNFLPKWNRDRIRKAEIYKNEMLDLNIDFLRGGIGSVWHHFCIFSEQRDALRAHLEKNGVGTDIHYPNLAAHEAQQFMGLKKERYPQAERIAATILSLPISPFHDDEMIEFVCKVIRAGRANENLF